MPHTRLSSPGAVDRPSPVISGVDQVYPVELIPTFPTKTVGGGFRQLLGKFHGVLLLACNFAVTFSNFTKGGACCLSEFLVSVTVQGGHSELSGSTVSRSHRYDFSKYSATWNRPQPPLWCLNITVFEK